MPRRGNADLNENKREDNKERRKNRVKQLRKKRKLERTKRAKNASSGPCKDTEDSLEKAKKDNEALKLELETKGKRISVLEEKAFSLETILREEASSSRRTKDANVTLEDNETWKKELEQKNLRIAELEGELIALKNIKDNSNVFVQSSKSSEMKEDCSMREGKESWRKELEAKDRRITQLENEVTLLKNLTMEQTDVQLLRNKRTKDNETWKQEIEAKNRRIVELEQEMESLENFLRDHADTESVRDLEAIVERKTRRIEELEDTVAEFEDFLKQNPDVKELHDLRCQLAASNRRVQELERWIQKNSDERESRIDQSRVMELEEMVTQLEEYVREHNVDVLKRKLQDRECRIEQLQSRVSCVEKELLRAEENLRGKEAPRKQENVEDKSTAITDDITTDRSTNFDDSELREREQKMKKMEHAISEKDDKIQAYEQQIAENTEEMAKLKEETIALRKELCEYDDIGVLKEEIRVRDERIQQLEDEIDSLERAFNERIDLEQIEELVNVIKEKEDKERQLMQDLEEKGHKIQELSEALRESVVIVSAGETKLKNEEKMRASALERIAKLEQRIASSQTASALKCITCQPLLSKLQNYETKLQRLTKEKTMQLEDLHQMKREALKAAISEKDAHLALLELSGLKTATLSEQAEQLKADRKRLLERLKKEDERSIEFSIDSSPTGSEGTPQLLTKILETSDDDVVDEEIVNDRLSESGSPRPATTNGDSCDHSKKTTKKLESRSRRENSEIHRQDSR